ncbi:chaperonin 10-like protein [Aspergillus californicus]
MPHPAQTAIIQTPQTSPTKIPLAITPSAAIPSIKCPHHVLVQVLAVALNPNDHKMVTHFNTPNSVAGCDFCGIIIETADTATGTLASGSGSTSTSSSARLRVGARVCGALFPYSPADLDNGSFAQFCVVDARLLVKVPDTWSDLEAASLGVGWSTISLALSDPKALGLEGTPTKPTHEGKEPVLVYGGGTASGTLACQMLKLMGYTPIAIVSTKSAPLAIAYGASATASYTAKDVIDSVKSLAGRPIRRVLDCITDADSAAICFGTMARTGGTYACLEDCPETWRTRRVVKVKEVMGFQVLGVDITLGGSTYTRPADQKLMDIGMLWAREMEVLMEGGSVRPHPLREVEGGWEGIIRGLEMLRKGEVRGEKLVVRIPQV